MKDLLKSTGQDYLLDSVSTLKGIGPTYMDKTGRNGIRVGDLELENWKEKYRTLADKHEKMIKFYDVDVQYDLAELEKEFFNAVKTLKSLTFIDSEAYLHEAQKVDTVCFA